mgnify:CR=1 FL=1
MNPLSTYARSTARQACACVGVGGRGRRLGREEGRVGARGNARRAGEHGGAMARPQLVRHGLCVWSEPPAPECSLSRHPNSTRLRTDLDNCAPQRCMESHATQSVHTRLPPLPPPTPTLSSVAPSPLPRLHRASPPPRPFPLPPIPPISLPPSSAPHLQEQQLLRRHRLSRLRPTQRPRGPPAQILGCKHTTQSQRRRSSGTAAHSTQLRAWEMGMM